MAGSLRESSAITAAFFDIGGLSGIRQELPAVFDATHARIATMIVAQEIDGVRVDHPDGLRDPLEYLKRLRALLPQGRIYVEKILENDERLKEDWPIDGTVGYEFLAKANRLWMDESTSRHLDRHVRRFHRSFGEFRGAGA
jgi:(1->4)-alpha-D-glucan 1-alpha-D-glucosylmutase